VPVGRLLGGDPAGARGPAGSCIAIVATDAPLGSEQLERLARRAGLGLARTGSVAHHGSGEIFLAFSTSGRVARDDSAASPARFPDPELDPLFRATVDATEEAVLNALWRAERTEGREGRVAERLPHADVLELLERHGRIGSQ
jgi:D-aminopeptidase